MKKILCFFLLLICVSVKAQTKGTVSIQSFTIDSVGTIYWEIRHTEKDIAFQIEELSDGKWIVINSVKETITASFIDQKEFFNKNKYLYKGDLNGSRFRLVITQPVALVSSVAEYKK